MQGRVGRDVRAAAGRRAVVGHVARPTAAVLRRKCPPKSVWGTIRVSRRPVRSDSRSIAASRFFHRRHRPEPGRRRQEERLGQGPDSGYGRSCPGVLPPFEIDRARTPASVRQAPAGRANEHAVQGSSQLAACAQQAPEPIAGCLGGASPTTADRGSSPFRLSSVLLFPFHRLLVISSCLVLSGRPAAGTSVTPVRFDRHLSGGQTCCPAAAQLAACAQQAAEPTAGCLGAASPTTADRGSSPFRPSSVLLFPVSPSSRYFLLSGPVRPPGGRYLSDAGSLRSAPVGRANMLPNCGSTRCLRAAGSGTDSRLPRYRFTNDRRPRLFTLPSIVRPPFSRFTVFSLFPPLWSCPAGRRPVPQ